MFSFKLRGAYNKMASLSAEQLARGVICSSAGNHAQGVALAASHLVRSRAPGRARVRVGQGRHLDAQGRLGQGTHLEAQPRFSMMTQRWCHGARCSATVCMPVTTPGTEADAVRRLGGRIDL